MAELFNSYRAAVDLSPLIELCEKEGKTVIFEKDEYLLHQGEVERYLYLIMSGYCRYVGLKSNGEEAVVGFAMKGEFVTDFCNGVRRLPSCVSTIASSRVEALRLPLAYAVNVVSRVMPQFLYEASDSLFRTCYTRLVELHALTPSERYQKFVDSYPDMVSCIMVKELASYLQITPQHLLRIKKAN